MKPKSSTKTVLLDFKPCLKSKTLKYNHNSNPFPLREENLFIGVYTGLSVEVIQEEAILQIYENGNYGKGSQSRGAKKNFGEANSESETLVLQLEEAFFLAYFLQILQIQDLNGIVLDWQQLLAYAQNIDSKFVENIAAYLYLKSKGWIIKSGSKFGGDFIIYKHGPEFFHASFVVYVGMNEKTEFFTPKNFKGIQRVAESSNKDVLLLEVTKPKEFELKSLQDLDKICIAETIVRRLKLSSFVQCPDVNK